MSIAKNVATVKSVALVGYRGEVIEVETDMKAGLPSLQIVGMGNKAIDEARQRVRSAIANSLLEFPARRITVNLAPAELPKDGTHLDLPIALSILVASGQLKPSEVTDALFVGELALNGRIRPVRGAIIVAETARDLSVSAVYMPSENVQQARLVSGVEIVGVSTLKDLYGHLKGFKPLKVLPTSQEHTPQLISPGYPSIDSVIGQDTAKRALIIAAAGRHNLVLSGPPGTGKTHLAHILTGLLPPLGKQEIIEVTKLHSLSVATPDALHTSPPLRRPHHSVTLTALIGGGLKPKPGDISLAHKGVLFLDELPEYPRATLESLRQPLEDRAITLSRLYGSITYPADVLLVATMNPCPCGFYGDPAKECSCSAQQIDSYKKRISGPLLDRIDLRTVVGRISNEHLFNSNTLIEKQHSKVLKLVLNAREHQKKRYNRRNYYNAYASIDEAKQLFDVSEEALELLKTASEKHNFSNRSYLRVLRVARTIADLEGSGALNQSHIAEALQFRS